MKSGKFAIAIFMFALISVIISPISFANDDPFPDVATGSAIPGTRISSSPGQSQSQWESTSEYKNRAECPAGSGNALEANATTKIYSIYCVKTWRPAVDVSADADFEAARTTAISKATLESQAWNAANPGKQKCVQWGPIVHANGVSTASGGVCANPVNAGAGTTVPSQEAPTVSAPTSSGSTTSTPQTVPTTSSGEFFPQWGSGTPYTRVLKGQLSTTECPSGFQGANGIIVAIGTGTFTECWPENAWAAYRLGGDIWVQFKNSGGTFNALTEVDRRNNVTALRALAKATAQTAADLTPGIQRCSKWTGYGEYGQECAYAFIAPTGTTPSTPTASETPTASTSSSNTSTAQQSASSDPFPNLANGAEILATRITSATGVSQSSWESTSTYKNFQCPAGSGRATGVDMNFTISQSDDKWFAYCVKSWRLSSSNNSDTNTVTSSSSNGSTGLSSQSYTETSTSGSPSVEASVVAVSGTAAEVKDLILKIITTKSEVTALDTVITKVDVVTKTYSKSIKLPVSRVLDEVATSLTPEICTTNGPTVTGIKKGTCLVTYTLTGDSGNSFTIQKTIVFKK
jgi:hypothetical protein